MKKLSFNIIGAGAMGHLWTSFLARADHRTNLYTRSHKQETEFFIQSPLGSFTQTLNYSTLLDWQDADVTLICVKAYQLRALCLELSQKKITSTQIILMMNGMGLVEIVQEYLAGFKVLHASIVHGVYIRDKTLIHTGKGETVLGTIDSGYSDYSDSQRDMLLEQLNQALPLVSWNKKHLQAMYLKLIVNAIINPITALNNQTNSSVLLNGLLNPQAEELLNELKPLLSIILPEMNHLSIKQKVEQVAYNTQSNISSMLQDVRAKKETEIDFINGYLVSFAKSKNINLPLHKKIILEIKQLPPG